MNGFQNIRSATNLINARFFYLRQHSKPLADLPVLMPEIVPLSIFSMPLSFHLEDPTNLVLISKETGVSKEKLAKKAEELGREVIGDYAYTHDKVVNLSATIPIEIRKAIDQILVKTSCPYSAIIKPMSSCGIKINKTLFDPAKQNVANPPQSITSKLQMKLEAIETNEVEKTKLETGEDFQYRNGMLINRKEFWALIKCEKNEAIPESIRNLFLEKPPFPVQEVIPLKALSKYKSKNIVPDFALAESHYDSGILLKGLEIAGNKDVEFYPIRGKDQPLLVKTTAYMIIIPPRIIDSEDTESERNEIERIKERMLTLDRIILNHKGHAKITNQPFSLLTYHSNRPHITVPTCCPS